MKESRAEMPSSRYTEQIQSFPSTSLSYTVLAAWWPPLARAVRPLAQYHAARVPYVGALENILSAYARDENVVGYIHEHGEFFFPLHLRLRIIDIIIRFYH